MTKYDIEKIIDRYPYINKAVKSRLPNADFKISNRKFRIVITEDLKTVLKVIEDVYETEKNENIRVMIRLLKCGESDLYIMKQINYEKNGYYKRKNAFIEKVHKCCIYRGLVSIDEILGEAIA